jgi:hypothetical protein
LIFDYPTPAGVADLLLTQFAGQASSSDAPNPDGPGDAAAVLAELERLERSLDPGDAGPQMRLEVATRLRRLTAAWDSAGAVATLDEEFDLDNASDQDIFDLMDNEFGRP